MNAQFAKLLDLEVGVWCAYRALRINSLHDTPESSNKLLTSDLRLMRQAGVHVGQNYLDDMIEQLNQLAKGIGSIEADFCNSSYGNTTQLPCNTH